MGHYDIVAYGAMVADEVRRRAYRDAMQEHIGGDATVLDIGTGTGLYALIACKLGARRVYAVEPSETIQVAREIARDNGFADRIEFIQDDSTRVELPEPVDVVVSDLRGVLPFFGRHIPSIIDARERLLRPGGTLIPLRDELRAAPVDDAELYAQIVGPWMHNGDGLDLSAARNLTTHRVHRKRVAAGALLAAPTLWTSVDYTRVASPNARGSVDCRVERAGTVHGISTWFDGVLSDRVRFTNAPGEPDLVYGAVFLPLPEAVAVGAGDTIRFEIGANLIGDDYIWRWNTSIMRHGGREPEVHFEQSSFRGAPLSLRSLECGAADYVPALSRDGDIDRAILEMIDGDTPLRRMAKGLVERYPEAFATFEAALDRVAALSRRYADR